MNTSKYTEALKIGKEYEIIEVIDTKNDVSYVIIDEQKHKHEFPSSIVKNFFKIVES